MEQTPEPKARPQVSLIFSFGGGETSDVGPFLSSFEYKAMVNGGYIIRGKFFDTNFNRLDELIKQGYFLNARDPAGQIMVKFQIRWGPESETEMNISRTGKMTAALLTLKHSGKDSSDKGLLEFVAIDPPSFYLNSGLGTGEVYTGTASDVMKQVIEYYTPCKVTISKTYDNEKNKWYMLRQDPKTFISSMIDWSPSLTATKTHWIVSSHDNNIYIEEQGKIKANPRGYYNLLDVSSHSDIKTWEMLADHGLAQTQSALITQGVSAISGQYLDWYSDPQEKYVVIKDENTPNKQIAQIKSDRGFKKPSSIIGASSISSIPEIYSAGDLGYQYQDYIDGRPRGMWLNMINSVMRIKITIIGHGRYTSPYGLGTDYVYLAWTSGKESSGGGDRYYWMTGNWIIYGFEHKVTRSFWYTDLYCARFDYDSIAKKVGTAQLTPF